MTKCDKGGGVVKNSDVRSDILFEWPLPLYSVLNKSGDLVDIMKSIPFTLLSRRSILGNVTNLYISSKHAQTRISNWNIYMRRYVLIYTLNLSWTIKRLVISTVWRFCFRTWLGCQCPPIRKLKKFDVI